MPKVLIADDLSPRAAEIFRGNENVVARRIAEQVAHPGSLDVDAARAALFERLLGKEVDLRTEIGDVRAALKAMNGRCSGPATCQSICSATSLKLRTGR